MRTLLLFLDFVRIFYPSPIAEKFTKLFKDAIAFLKEVGGWGKSDEDFLGISKELFRYEQFLIAKLFFRPTTVFTIHYSFCISGHEY